MTEILFKDVMWFTKFVSWAVKLIWMLDVSKNIYLFIFLGIIETILNTPVF